MTRPAVVRIGREPGVVVEVSALGATARRIEVGGSDGARRNVVLGHRSDAEQRASPHYLGGTVGRVANRIGAGRFEFDGRAVAVPTPDRGNALHGGPVGFDKRVWDAVATSPDAVTLRLVSPDGDQGFPGTLTAEVTYAVRGCLGDTVRVEQRATTDATTVASLTNHAYLNLDGEGSGSVDDHLLSVSASTYTPVDELDIPLGTLAPVDGTPLDLRAEQRVGDAVRRDHPITRATRGIDANLVVDGEGRRPMAVLTAARSGIRLELWADAPCLQVYTGNKLDGTTIGTGGGVYRQGDGIALEPQSHPGAVQHPAFPSIALRPGETYASTFEWRFCTTAS